MKLRPNSWLPLLVAVLLLAGLGILVYKTSLGDSGQRAQVNLDLRDLKEIDAEWSLDVLRSKNDINKNYDPINGPLQALASNQDRLDTLATQIDASSLRGPVDALKKSLTEKIDLIDSFKMQNALLKNSLRFLPTAVVQLQEQVRLARQAYDKATKPGTAKPLDDLERIADKVLTGILNYGLSSDPGVRADVQGLLSELASSRVTQPGKVAAQIDTLVNHSQVVLRQKGIEDGVLLAIAKVPTVSNINALADSFEKIFRAKAQTQGQWRQGLVVYSIGLLALLMFSAFKLFESYRSLNEANSRLEKANVTLEDRVQLRTSELSDALNILKESQVQLFQAEKMASLGQMVAGIAHEINTPLAYVKNSVQIAHARMKDVKVLVDESAKLWC